MSGPFEVLQVGAGFWGKEWAELIHARARGFRLCGLVDTERRAREWASDALGCPTFRDLAGALRNVECDAVLIVTPPVSHRAVAEEALEAGYHVAVEKPLALNLADARAVAETSARTGRVAMVAQNYRFRRQPRALEHLVRTRSLGELRGGRVSCRRDLRGIHERGDWRGRMHHPYLFDMAIHHVDLMRMITREDVIEVDARSWASPDGPFRHDASVVGVITLAGGAALGYEGSWVAASGQTPWNGDWELVGSRGQAAWTGGFNNALRGRITLDRSGVGQTPVPTSRRPAPELRRRSSETVALPSLPALDRLGVLHELRRATLAGEDPECSARDNLQSLAAVLAMARSTEERRPVRVEEVLAS